MKSVLLDCIDYQENETPYFIIIDINLLTLRPDNIKKIKNQILN